MSYNPVVRGMYLTCNSSAQNSSPYVYFSMFDITQSDYKNLTNPGTWGEWYMFLGMFPAPIGNWWGCSLGDSANSCFTQPGPNDQMVSVLLPVVPGISPQLFPNFSVSYKWTDPQESQTGVWNESLAINGAASKSGGTIIPPTSRPHVRDNEEAENIDDPLTFLLQSATNSNTPTGLGVVINVPEGCSNWMSGAADVNDATILALTVGAVAGNPAGLSVYSQEILGSYTSVYVIFPDGSVSDTVPINASTVYKI
jgi:hypothetical protein